MYAQDEPGAYQSGIIESEEGPTRAALVHWKGERESGFLVDRNNSKI